MDVHWLLQGILVRLPFGQLNEYVDLLRREVDGVLLLDVEVLLFLVESIPVSFSHLLVARLVFFGDVLPHFVEDSIDVFEPFVWVCSNDFFTLVHLEEGVQIPRLLNAYFLRNLPVFSQVQTRGLAARARAVLCNHERRRERSTLGREEII